MFSKGDRGRDLKREKKARVDNIQNKKEKRKAEMEDRSESPDSAR